MNPKTQLVLVALGGGAVLIVIAGLAGKSTTQGVVFQAPNPASVAAVTTAAEAEVASGNALAAQRAHDTLTAITTLGAQNTELALGQLQLSATQDTNKTNLSTVGLQVSGADFASTEQTKQVQAQSAGAAAAAQALADAQIQVVGLQTAEQSHVADQAAAAALAADAAKTTQVQSQSGAQKTTGFFSAIGNIIGSIFGGKKGG